VLSAATGPVVAPEVAEQAEVKLLAKKSMWMTMRWRKWRDAPLADIVLYKLRRRARLGMDEPDSVKARIERVRLRSA
jgi:hypothetical protein